MKNKGDFKFRKGEKKHRGKGGQQIWMDLEHVLLEKGEDGIFEENCTLY